MYPQCGFLLSKRKVTRRNLTATKTRENRRQLDRTTDSPILTGLQIYHNYIRPHMGLEGKTPADLAGIHVEGQDKWLTLIQNASQPTKLDKGEKDEHPTST